METTNPSIESAVDALLETTETETTETEVAEVEEVEVEDEEAELESDDDQLGHVSSTG